jgi:hypothetical protein
MKMKSQIEAQVDHLFRNAPDRFEELRRNPVTGGWWVSGLDPIEEQEQAAHRALTAQAWFARTGPKDAPPLPLSDGERHDLKYRRTPLDHIVSLFALSLSSCDYAFEEHASFDDFARGVLASPEAPDFVRDQDLLKRYPPCPLPGLGRGLYWEGMHQLAPIRHTPLLRQRATLNGPAPAPIQSEQDLIDRADANFPNWYPAWANRFLLVNDDFIAHATECAANKRLPRGWRVDKPGDVFCRVLGEHKVWVIGSDHGWLIERSHLLDHDRDHDQVLAHFLLEAPLLCPTYILAARLAEAAYPAPPDDWQLSWHSY